MTNDARTIRDFLSRTAPFSGAGGAELDAVASAAALRRASAGSALYSEGERAAAAWAVVSGRVRILAFAGGPRTIQIERLGPGQVFGVCCRLGGGVDRYPCTAVAETDSEVVRVPDAAFFALFRRSAPVARQCAELCSRRLLGMCRLAGAGRVPVRERLARVLLDLRESGGDRVRATRLALSALVGAAPETVFRALGVLRRRGVIRTGRGTVEILDARALKAEAEPDQR